MRLMKGGGFLVLLFWFAMYDSCLRADMVYPLDIFIGEGGYYDGLNLYVEVSDGAADQVDFTFYNDSSPDSSSSIARIYFDDDDGSFLGTPNIVENSGTSFSLLATPGNLPGRRSLDPAFETTGEFSIGGDPAPPKNGVNPGEWATITFDLINDGMPEDVIGQLNTGTLRIGAHVIALPDGLGGSGVAVPEPGTLMLLGTAGLWIFIRKRRFV